MKQRTIFRLLAFLLGLSLALTGCTGRGATEGDDISAEPESIQEPGVARYQPPELSVTTGETRLTLPPAAYVWSSVDQYGAYLEVRQEDQDPLDGLPILSVGNETLSALAQLPYSALEVEVHQGDETVFSDAFANIHLFAPENEVEYEVVLTGKWEEDDYYGNCVYRFRAGWTLQPEFVFDPPSVKLGEVMKIYGYHIPGGVEVSATTDLRQAPRFFDYNGAKMGFLAIHYNDAAGSYPLRITVGDQAYDYMIQVDGVKWEVEYLQVEESVASSTINSAAAQAEYTKVTAPLKEISDSRQYWEGAFALPLAEDTIQSITSEYGLIRYINNGPNPSRHDALDYAASGGTPVYATNHGRVIYAGFLQMTGNTVVIEHGFGVKSWYFHMRALHTETDAMVEKGDLIGEVGTTGFSTGNHLHFGVSINKIFVNPHRFLESDPLPGVSGEETGTAG